MGRVSAPVPRLVVPDEHDADTLYLTLAEWAGEQGLTLYPHQDEALLEVLSGNNVVLATPTGSGKSLVATGAHLAALADGRVSFYTAPIKALVSEKFFALCEVVRGRRRRDADRRRRGQRGRPDHRLHRRGAGQHRPAGGGAGRRRARGDGRVPLLRRARPRLGLAGAAARAAPRPVPADVGDARRHVGDRGRPVRAHRSRDRRRRGRRAAGPAQLQLVARPARRDRRGAGHDRPGTGVRRALHAGGRGRARDQTARRAVSTSSTGSRRTPSPRRSARSGSAPASARPCNAW